jgi:uncharacterized RDD family membrane protein YckC
MADDQQQSGQPPAGGPGSSSPQDAAPQQQPPEWGQAPQTPGYQPPAWGQAPQQPPAWGQPPQQPPYGQPAGYPPPPYGQPAGYPPPPYGQPAGYPPAGFAYGPRYAGFWIRFVATIIDGFILAAITIVCVITVVGVLALPFVWLGYMPALWWKRGGTFGQTMLGLRVVRAIDGGPIDGGMAVVRAVVYYVESFLSSWLIGLIGFAWAAFEPRKRAWHDMAAGTVVISVN